MISFNALRLRFRLVASDFPGIVCILNGKYSRQGLAVTQTDKFHDLQLAGDSREQRINQTEPRGLAAVDIRGEPHATALHAIIWYKIRDRSS